jgi:phosphohistidine phosphatase SixA
MKRRAGLLVFLLLAAWQSPGTQAQDDAAQRAIEAARQGGTVLLCRHGITNQSDPENELTLRYDDPATQRRLSPEGERQSEAMGQALRRLGIEMTEVVASPMQRARRMAELMFGRVTLDSMWHTRGNNYEAMRDRRRQALSTPVASGNRIIISHVGTMQSVVSVRGSLQEGDCVVLRPRGNQFTVIGAVPWRAWSR